MEGNFSALLVTLLVFSGLYLAIRGLIRSKRPQEQTPATLWERVGIGVVLLSIVGVVFFRDQLAAVAEPNRVAMVISLIVWGCFFGYLISIDRLIRERTKKPLS